MERRHLSAAGLALAALAAFPALAAAQTPIRFGDTLSGRLEAGDPKMEDESHYDLFTFQGTQGQRAVITLRSDAFDTYLAVGRMQGSELDVVDSDDDGGGGTNSRIEITLPETGTYTVRANSLGAGETGDYTISLALGVAPPPPPPPTPIRLGQTVQGELSATDPRAGDDSHYDMYVFRGTAGQSLVITMRSEAFDAYLSAGGMADGEFEESDSDDDGAGGTDARLEVTVPASGVLMIRANSLSEGETGAYTLLVEAAAAAARPATR